MEASTIWDIIILFSIANFQFFYRTPQRTPVRWSRSKCHLLNWFGYIIHVSNFFRLGSRFCTTVSVKLLLPVNWLKLSLVPPQVRIFRSCLPEASVGRGHIIMCKLVLIYLDSFVNCKNQLWTAYCCFVFSLSSPCFTFSGLGLLWLLFRALMWLSSLWRWSRSIYLTAGTVSRKPPVSRFAF